MTYRDMAGLTMAFNSSALTTATGEAVHDSTVAMNYCINGKVYQKSGTNADQTTPTTDYNTSAAFKTLTGTTTSGQASVFVWCYDSSQAVKVVQGEVVDTDASGNYKLAAPEFPAIPDSLCPFAYQVLKKYGTAATFTFGTSNWNVATNWSSSTNTITNICTLPNRPQSA